MKYVIYARKSTEDDDRQVLSIKAQLVELREFVAKEKLEIFASFQEAKIAKEPGEKHQRKPYFDIGGRENFYGTCLNLFYQLLLPLLASFFGYGRVEVIGA